MRDSFRGGRRSSVASAGRFGPSIFGPMKFPPERSPRSGPFQIPTVGNHVLTGRGPQVVNPMAPRSPVLSPRKSRFLRHSTSEGASTSVWSEPVCSNVRSNSICHSGCRSRSARRHRSDHETSRNFVRDGVLRYSQPAALAPRPDLAASSTRRFRRRCLDVEAPRVFWRTRTRKDRTLLVGIGWPGAIGSEVRHLRSRST